MNTGLAYNMRVKASYIIILSTLLSLNTWAAEQLSDPTMPPHYKVNQASSSVPISASHYEWVLNSTIISPHLKVAIINDRQLKVGEEINGAVVKNISHQKVELVYQKQTITLLLHHSFISQIKSTTRP